MSCCEWLCRSTWRSGNRGGDSDSTLQILQTHDLEAGLETEAGIRWALAGYWATITANSAFGKEKFHVLLHLAWKGRSIELSSGPGHPTLTPEVLLSKSLRLGPFEPSAGLERMGGAQ